MATIQIRLTQQGLITIRSLYNATPGCTHRPQQWLNRLLKQAKNAPDSVKKLCRPVFFEGVRASDGELKPVEALTLLTYNANHGKYVDLIAEIEKVGGVKLPVKPHNSRFEAIFGSQLQQLLENLYGTTGYMLQSQRKIGPYFVDFYITVYGEEDRNYIVEFDEDAHDKKKYYLLNDPIRNRWFRKNHPNITLIRVKHRESKTWLNAVYHHGELISMEKLYAHCIQLAAETPTAQRLRITSQSAKKAYDMEQNQLAFLLTSPKHKIKELKAILTRLKVPYDGRRVINLSRATLRRR